MGDRQNWSTEVYTLFQNIAIMTFMQSSTTSSIVEALTRAIVEHRLQPGAKLAEQKLADHFGVSRTLVRPMTPAKIKTLKDHVAQEKQAVTREDVAGRTELLGDFHVRMAELTGNQVLAQILGKLIARCALITLMYQSASAAQHS